MGWTQVYDPLGSVWGSTLIAALPTVLLLGLLATGKVSAHVAAGAGLLSAWLVAVLVYVPNMEELSYGQRVASWSPTMLAAAMNGAMFGLFPIGWIVLSAIFLYNLTVSSGRFEVVKHSVTSLSDDRRVQALLFAFCFGAFMEGAAGFGTPVAISAALMLGAGFRPIYAAGLALIANTSPVAFGGLGTPITTLADVTRLDVNKISMLAGRQLPIFSLFVPVWLVWVMSGWKGVRGAWPALVVCGGSFATVQFVTANYLGPFLVDVAGGLISLVCMAVLLKFWQPREVWRFPDETVETKTSPAGSPETPQPGPRRYTTGEVVSAWVPWLLLSGFVFAWGLPQVKPLLGAASKPEKKDFSDSDAALHISPLRLLLKLPALHLQIARDRPVVPQRKPEEAVYELPWLALTGTSIFLAAIVSAVWLGISPARFAGIFAHTCWNVRWPLLTISCMLAIAYVTRYSGMDATLGLAFTRTGWTYPFFAPLLGWLGVALTGSDTSSNALFGSLQTITAGRLVNEGVVGGLSVDQAQLLFATANSTGGVMGKMIDAQSIVVAAVATQQHGQEGPILRFVFWHSLILAALMGVLVFVQAYFWTSAIPL